MIFLFNGPPGCGKDTAAHEAAVTFDGFVEKFARPLKEVACLLYFNGKTDEFRKYDTFELKDEKLDVFFGLSCRDVQIAISEKFLKPLHDNKIFGRLLAQRILDREHIFISDSGFREEAEVLVEKFGPENVVLIRIHREGHDFSKDSRSYISLYDLGVKEYDVKNIEDYPEILHNAVYNIVDNRIKEHYYANERLP